jgi:hypothetical protein
MMFWDGTVVSPLAPSGLVASWNRQAETRLKLVKFPALQVVESQLKGPLSHTHEPHHVRHIIGSPW